MKWFSVLVFSFFLHLPTQAATWLSLTWDNDIFAGQDHGYTNGLFVSTYNVGPYPNEDTAPKPGLLVSPFKWILPSIKPKFSVNSYTLGQVMITPKDIRKKVPDPDDLPYTGILFVTNTYIAAQDNSASKLSITMGVVGPASGAEGAQTFIHKITDSTTPQGWSSQLENELVLQMELAKIWRPWFSNNKKIDMVNSVELSVGLIKVSATSSALLRWGTQLENTFVTPAFTSTRTSNPIAVHGGWFLFSGIKASYIASQVFVDGNTFRESLSTELDHTQFGTTLGATYSWGKYSLSIAMEKLHQFEEDLEGVSEYGTLTFAWQK